MISTLGNNSLDEGKKARRELISERGCVARIIRRYNMVVRTKGRETERERVGEGEMYLGICRPAEVTQDVGFGDGFWVCGGGT